MYNKETMNLKVQDWRNVWQRGWLLASLTVEAGGVIEPSLETLTTPLCPFQAALCVFPA